MCAVRVIAKHVAKRWPIEAYAKPQAVITAEQSIAKIQIARRGCLPADVVAVHEKRNVRLIFLLGVIIRIQRVSGGFKLGLKGILRDLLPGDCPIASQIVCRPVTQRPLFGAARLSVPDGPIRDSPVFWHRREKVKSGDLILFLASHTQLSTSLEPSEVYAL